MIVLSFPEWFYLYSLVLFMIYTPTLTAVIVMIF